MVISTLLWVSSKTSIHEISDVLASVRLPDCGGLYFRVKFLDYFLRFFLLIRYLDMNLLFLKNHQAREHCTTSHSFMTLFLFSIMVSLDQSWRWPWKVAYGSRVWRNKARDVLVNYIRINISDRSKHRLVFRSSLKIWINYRTCTALTNLPICRVSCLGHQTFLWLDWYRV